MEIAPLGPHGAPVASSEKGADEGHEQRAARAIQDYRLLLAGIAATPRGKNRGS